MDPVVLLVVPGGRLSFFGLVPLIPRPWGRGGLSWGPVRPLTTCGVPFLDTFFTRKLASMKDWPPLPVLACCWLMLPWMWELSL